MTTYIVTKTYKYTETVEIDAESKHEAEEKAMHTEGETNHDDWLYSCEAMQKGQP